MADPQVKEMMARLPRAAKEEVRRAHHQLGHADRETVLRLARAADESEDHL